MCSIDCTPTCTLVFTLDPDKPPMVEWDQSVVFPDNAALRNVTVGWKVHVQTVFTVLE